MKMLNVKTFADLMHGHDSAEILCPMQGTIVRKLARVGKNDLKIDALTEVVTVPLNWPIRYEPWVLDRGNLLFDLPQRPNCKICTEMDTIKFPDGTSYTIAPEVN